MYSFEFKHNGFKYSLDMGNQTLTNKATGEIRAVEQLRDHNLIAAVHKCMNDAENERYYKIIVNLMVKNLKIR
jgi:hypothetical protein